MILDYLNERYLPTDFSPLSLEEVAALLPRAYKAKGASALVTDYGFITYSLSGDAMLIYDIYVKPEARRSGKAWEMFHKLRDKAEAAKKHVMIAFTEIGGKNHHYGHTVVEKSGFKPYLTLKTKQTYIREV